MWVRTVYLPYIKEQLNLLCCHNRHRSLYGLIISSASPFPHMAFTDIVVYCNMYYYISWLYQKPEIRRLIVRTPALVLLISWVIKFPDVRRPNVSSKLLFCVINTAAAFWRPYASSSVLTAKLFDLLLSAICLLTILPR